MRHDPSALPLAGVAAALLFAPTAVAQPAKRDQPLKTPAPPAASATGQPNSPPPIGKAPDLQYREPKPGSTVNINMSDVELDKLVETISDFTGKRFIMGGKIRPGIKATIISPKPVTPYEAYEAFLSVLQTNGLTVIPHGRYLKIVESAGISNDVTEVFGTATPVPNVDRYVTRLYRLRHADAGEVQTVLQKLKTKDGDVTVYAPSNLLIITDTGADIRRMMRIIEEVDSGGAGEQIWIQPINNVSATDLAQKLTELLDAGGGKARIFADDRNNQLIMVATESDYLRLLELIKRMDVKATGEGGIHVLGLQHAACDELLSTLGQILGGPGGSAGGRAGAAAGGRAQPARNKRAPGARGGTSGGIGAAAAVSGAAGGVFEQEVKVSCDIATNSLVTVSTLRDYIELRNLVDRLDRPRRQVFLDAVIMDITVDHKRDLGLGYHAGTGVDLGGGGQTLIYGGLDAADSLAGVPADLTALAFGVRGPDLQGSQTLLNTGKSIPAFGVVLDAVATSGDSNVLATPHVLATDNITAEINIGANIPIQTNIGGFGGAGGALGGAAGGAAAGGVPGGFGFPGMFGGFAAPRQDVGIKLSITPHVNDSDQVRMEISEEFSNPGTPQGQLGVVPINKRTAETTVVVRDQQTVVIGGLVREAQVNSETKIPVLGDIPVLGILFRKTSNQTQRSNLLLILTPHIVRDPSDLRRVFERKMQERQEFLDRFFVFDETTSWEPPIDYSHAIGLLEAIRQTQLDVEERERLAAELRPKRPNTHDPVKPIALPSMGGGPAGGKGGTRPAPARPGGFPTSPTPARPAFRTPGGATGSPRRYRIE